MKTGFLWVQCLLVVLRTFPAYSQNAKDTLVEDAAILDAHRYIRYYIDSSAQKGVAEIVSDKAKFKPWGSKSNLNLGLNPYPLWLHLKITGVTGKEVKYWLSFYTQADSVLVFQRLDTQFSCTDTLSYNIAQSERQIKTRFLALPLNMEAGKTRELYVKIISHTKTQNFIAEIATPEANLLWERDFSWLVLFFTGCFTLAAFISLIAAFVLRERTFFYYGIYIITSLLLLLSQELMLPIFSPRWFAMLNAIHPMSLAIIGLNVQYWVILYITGAHDSARKIMLVFRRINRYCLYYGIASMAGYFLSHRAALTQIPLYHLFYDLNVGLIFLLLLVTFLTIVLSAVGSKQKIGYTAAASLLFYFNPAGYYLNYSGLVPYYEITYPNYFYWVLCLELVVLGCVISWRFRETLKEKNALIREKEQWEQQNYIRELEVQEREKKQIARDLHDDLGATLSAIKLIITNNYKTDQHLVKMIAKANTDLRHFFSKLSSSGLKERGLFHTLEERKTELNKSGAIHFSLIVVGNDKRIPDAFLLPVYRITNELLTNILRHSGATDALLQLVIDESQLELITEDNGKGYDTTQKNTGMGLNNIRNRVQQLKGKIHVSSNLHGTTTIISIPLTDKQYEQEV